MIKLFVTGDNHIGKRYDRYPQAKEKLIKSRIDSIEGMVREAEYEKCDLFIVTGDLFDRINSIKVGDVKRVVDILSSFDGCVLVLPGNHDYYTGEEKVWNDFEKAMDSQDHNITILKEFKPYTFELGDERVIVYPSYCQSKHSKENNLAWIKDEEIPLDNSYKIGVAHGAISGVTPDLNNEYFLMTETELLSIPVDVWLIGHTHIQYPILSQKDTVTGYRIFNAGTHEQTDLHNSTEGCCFIISIDKSQDSTRVSAHKYISGKIRYYDMDITVKPNSDNSLKKKNKKRVSDIDENSVIRINVSGTVKTSEYENRKAIYNSILNRFLAFEAVDSELSEEISIDKIHSEFSEMSFASKLMESLMNNPLELQMAYELMKDCKE